MDQGYSANNKPTLAASEDNQCRSVSGFHVLQRTQARLFSEDDIKVKFQHMLGEMG